MQQLSYLKFLERSRDETEILSTDLEDVRDWMQVRPINNHIQPSVLYFLDYVQYRYIFMYSSNKCFLGYDIPYVLDAGPGLILSMFHKDDGNIIDKKIFPENMNYLNQHSDRRISSTLFSYTYRLKAKDGDYHEMCHHSSYVGRAKNGAPLGVIGLVSDISAFQKDTRIMHCIEDRDSGPGTAPSPILRYYYPDDGQSFLTTRELDVLKWAADGYSSKQIAIKLHISIHTVNNHRKNMLEKCHCSNFSELLNYAIKNRMT